MSLSTPQRLWVGTIFGIVVVSLTSLFFQPSAEASDEPSDEVVNRMMYESQCYELASAAGYPDLMLLHSDYVIRAGDIYPDNVGMYLVYMENLVTEVSEDTGLSRVTVGEILYAKFCFINTF